MNSSKSSKDSEKSSSLPGSQQGDIRLHCGDIVTTNNYNTIIPTDENHSIPIPSFYIPDIVVVEKKDFSTASKRSSNPSDICVKDNHAEDMSFKRQKLKSVHPKLGVPTKTIYSPSSSGGNLDFENIENSCSQGGTSNNNHHQHELEEIEIVPPPEKPAVQIIDVDADPPVLEKYDIETYIAECGDNIPEDFERYLVQLRCMENKNDRVMKTHSGLFSFPKRKKFREFLLPAMGCSYLYTLLMDGYKKGNGILHLPKVLSKTYKSSTRVSYCVLPGYDSYGNHHGKDTPEAVVNQRYSTTSIQNQNKMRELFSCLPTLKDLIKLFELDHFGLKDQRNYNLKIIDILRQSSSGELGGREALFRLHKDKVPGEQKNIILSVIFTLSNTMSMMKVVGDEEFEYDLVGKGIMFFSELWHESIYASESTLKMALFYEGNTKVKKKLKTQEEQFDREYETSETNSRQV